ncbi:14-3-3 family protein artA-like [Carex rostrata]
MARSDEVFFAKMAEQAKRYDDMIESIKRVCEINADLSDEERNLLSAAYKNKVGSCRASWRVITANEQNEEQKGETEHLRLIKNYRQKVESEQEEICKDAINVIDTYLIPQASNAESIVFYKKMKGDYYRYLSEIKVGDDRVNIANEAMKAYVDASGIATEELAATHPIRLGLALNYSVFYYEIYHNAVKACEMAKTACEKALAELDSLSDETYKDSTLIMQLLRDNITLWQADLPPNEGYVDPLQFQ